MEKMMSKNRSTTEINTELAEVRSATTKAAQAADQAELERLRCLDANPPNLDGVERKAAARDRLSRSSNRAIMGRPSKGRICLPGRRVEPIRASTIMAAVIGPWGPGR